MAKAHQHAGKKPHQGKAPPHRRPSAHDRALARVTELERERALARSEPTHLRVEDRSDPIRVVVFYDWMNAYNRTHEVLLGRKPPSGPLAPPTVDPVKLARWLTGNNDQYKDRRELKGVRVYQGVAASNRDDGELRKRRESDRRYKSWWERYGDLVTPVKRDLDYREHECGSGSCPHRGRPDAREKGIDVHLALDVLHMVIEDQLDVAVLISTDKDFWPVVDLVGRLPRLPDSAFPAIETVIWKGADTVGLWRGQGRYHSITSGVLEDVRDDTDYSPA